MQELIASLSGFYEERGGTTLPPLDVEVQSGVLAPPLFFRLLAPKPCRVAQLLVVRQPSEGRFGSCDLHLVKGLRFEVLIKQPEIAAPHSLLLDSLRPAGLEPAALDVQFVDLEWRAPRFATRGAGWAARFNGVPIARVLYLQEVGGQSCDPPPLCLSYALEPVAWLSQEIGPLAEAEWSAAGELYGEVRSNDESELSRYYFEVAEEGAARQRLERAFEEAERCAERGLTRPSYELLLRAELHFSVWQLGGTVPAAETELWDERFASAVRRLALLAQKQEESQAHDVDRAELRANEGAA